MTPQLTIWQDDTLNLAIKTVTDITSAPFCHLQLCYECEFSPITGAHMNHLGVYDQALLASYWSKLQWDAYIFEYHSIPAGLCVVNKGSMIFPENTETHDIAEFYITPIFRSKKLGTIFASAIFSLYPGTWEVRQLSNLANTATLFWRKAIGEFTKHHFQEFSSTKEWSGIYQTFISNH